MTPDAIAHEFDHQVETLIQKDYPTAAHLSTKEFLLLIDPLKKNLANIPSQDIDMHTGYLPFVIVVKSSLVSSEDAMGKISRQEHAGITKLAPLVPVDFSSIESVDIPNKTIYLLIDIDRGRESLNIRPQDALITIQEATRSPLTIDEGIAIVTQYPEFLMRNNCFSLLASRHKGDKRVPAIWINGKNHPNLGWCWDGNPHTWLGSASGKKRLA